MEFPRELRDPESAAEGDNKELHQQEERRLFYVAMTRARDTLTIYAKKGTGKKDDTPPGLLRDLLKNMWLRDWISRRDPKPRQTEIFAAAAPPVIGSRTTEWLDLPPMMDLSERLSASAVQRYETCPLQFKLEREWRIPSEVPGAMQYGAAMHRVLKSYYDSVRAGRELPEAKLIELFELDIHEAGIQDHYQLELYVRQGISQLKAFLEACRCGMVPEVLHVEEWFDVRVGETLVTGRIDRMDRTGDGRVVITDYKTGKPRSQEDADESLQLSIYALAARAKWGYQVDRLAFYNLDGNSSMVTLRSDLATAGSQAESRIGGGENSQRRLPSQAGVSLQLLRLSEFVPGDRKAGWLKHRACPRIPADFTDKKTKIIRWPATRFGQPRPQDIVATKS